MDFEDEYEDEQDGQKLPAVIAGGTGAAVGVAATSGVAVSAAGASAAGATGYLAGVGALVAGIGCETAAIVGLGAILAGPLLGGALGYGIYRGVKKLSRG